METFSALLAFCVENSPVSGEFPAQRPVTRSFDVLFDLRLNKWLNKQSQGWWFVTPSCPLWRHYNEIMVSWVEGVRDRVRVRWVLASNYRLHVIWFLGIVIHYSYYCKCDGCNNLEIITCVMTISMMGRGIASYVKYTKFLGTPPCPTYDAPEWYAKNWNYFSLSLSKTMAHKTMAHISKNILYFIVGDAYSSMPKYK